MLAVISLRRFAAISPTINRFYSHDLSMSDDKPKKLKKSSRQLKRWRNIPETKNDSVLGMFNNTDDDDDEDKKEYTPRILNFDFKPANFKIWFRQRGREYLKWSQRYIEERHSTLGNQLATTHFVLHRGGKIKQTGVGDYLTPEDQYDLPRTFTPNWSIEEIDFSGSEICYEGLDNFRHLVDLKKISFKNCKHFDDWCLEKFIGLCPGIPYIDVSDCEKVTERGIEGLFRAWYLKKLIVTDFNNGPAFELTCMMLEDCLPGLEVEIIKAPVSKVCEKVQ